jgi:hypothetical protein
MKGRKKKHTFVLILQSDDIFLAKLSNLKSNHNSKLIKKTLSIVIDKTLNMYHFLKSLNPNYKTLHITFRPRQGKVDNRLLPGKTVKVSGKR